MGNKEIRTEKCISVDSGKSATKFGVYDPMTGNISQGKFRTKIGRGYFEDDALEKNTVIMEFGGKVYKIGNGAISEAEMETSKKSDIHKLCTLKAIASYMEDGKTEDVHVAIGMPVKEWENVQKRIEYKNFILPDEEVHVKIKNTADGQIQEKSFRIVSKHAYPETMGALFVREKPSFGRQGVIDLGHLNNNCAVWNGNDLDPNYTLTDILGGNNLVTGLAQELTAAFTMCDEKTVARVLMQSKENRYLHPNKPNKELEQRSKEIIDEYLLNHVKEIKKKVDVKHWPLDFMDLTFIGKTTALISDEIRQVFGPSVFIPDDPEYANALGFLRILCGKVYGIDIFAGEKSQ